MKTDPSPSSLSVRLHGHYTQYAKGDGATVLFALDKTPLANSPLAVYVSGLRKTPAIRGTANDYSVTGGTVTFAVAPVLNAPIVFDFVAT